MIAWPILLLLLSACAPQVPVWPASLQLVPPDFYSRTLRFTVEEHRRGRAVKRTYYVPVQVDRRTGDVRVTREARPGANGIERQLRVIQERIERLQERITRRPSLSGGGEME